MVETNILFVDDEKNILNSLQRVFRKEGYGILVADSGEGGLDLLRQKSVAVVVSDQRMPGMGGVEFLTKVREAAPDTVRMMLTGQADMAEIAGAINQGQIYRYITKPWDDDEIRLIVKAAVERYGLVAENRRLQAETMRQNEKLYELNQTLEKRVEDRTAKLRESFFAFAGLCADMIELHDRASGGHCKRVAAMAKGLAQRLGITGSELEIVWAAALLHQIGLVGVPRHVLEKPEIELEEDEWALLRNNPVLSQELLSGIDILRQVGLVVRSQKECFDGTGYPDGLKGEEINYCSRILAVCAEYDRLRHLATPFSKVEALAVVERGRGKKFDPAIVEAFLKYATEDRSTRAKEAGRHGLEDDPSVVSIGVYDIAPGMVLARHLVTGHDRLLVAKGTTLTEALIEKVLNFHRIDPIKDTVKIVQREG